MANDSVCGQAASPGEDVYSVTFPCTLKKRKRLVFSARVSRLPASARGTMHSAACIKARVRGGTATNTARGREVRRDTTVTPW